MCFSPATSTTHHHRFFTLLGVPDLEEAILQLEAETGKESAKEETIVKFLTENATTNILHSHAKSLVQSINRKDVIRYTTTVCRHVLDNMLIIKFKEARSDVMASVESLVYISQRLHGVPALSKVVQHFKHHYGKRLVAKATNDSNGVVSESIVSRLSDGICTTQVQNILLKFGKQQSTTTSVKYPFSIASERSHCNNNTTNYNKLSRQPQEHQSRESMCGSTGDCDGWEQLPTTFGTTQLSFDVYDVNDKAEDVQTSSSIPLSLLAPTLPIFIFNPNSNLEIGFDARTRNPLYVLERIGGIKHPSSLNSRPQFFEQQALPEIFRSKLHHYFRSGYDRGHMAPVADFPEAQKHDTFTLCNVSPQLHGMNCSTWAKLEHWCRKVARNHLQDNHASTFVVTGPLWLPSKHGDTEGEDFQFSFPAIGSSATSLVQVPTHFFKVLVVLSNPSIQKFACFVVPNTKTNADRSSQLQQYIVKWTELEAMSGLQFFPSLTNENRWKERADLMAEDAMAGFKKTHSKYHGANRSPLKKNNKVMSTDEGSSLEHLCLQ